MTVYNWRKVRAIWIVTLRADLDFDVQAVDDFITAHRWALTRMFSYRQLVYNTRPEVWDMLIRPAIEADQYNEAVAHWNAWHMERFGRVSVEIHASDVLKAHHYGGHNPNGLDP